MYCHPNRYFNHAFSGDDEPTILRELGSAETKAEIFAASQVAERLPMLKCMESTEAALAALSEGRGAMPLRTVMPLPLGGGQTGFLGMMPSYLPGEGGK